MERVTGRPYEELLQSHVTGPDVLGMHDTACSLNDAQSARHVPGYVLKRDAEAIFKVSSSSCFMRYSVQVFQVWDPVSPELVHIGDEGSRTMSVVQQVLCCSIRGTECESPISTPSVPRE